MLKEVYLDALKNRDAKISKIKDSSYEKILKEAALRWILYDPAPTKCQSAGVDSSWNKRAFQGLNLYVVDAVAITSANEILASEFKDDIAESARREELETIAMGMEASVAQKAADRKEVDVICIDGSLITRTLRITPEAAAGMVKKYGSSVFISKTSESRWQFGSLGSKAGDIYYYGHANRPAGFSVPVETQSRHAKVFEFYARLKEHTPVVRIEVIGETNEAEVKNILDRLRYHSVSGYPYCLKLAHNTCKISNEDIDRLASMLSLQQEQGARDALNE